jgi:hypothetical protein
MPGYVAQHRTLTVTESEAFIGNIDFKLARASVMLGGVRTLAARPKPVRTDAVSESSVGGSVSYAALSNGLTGDLTGDLTSALLPNAGLTITPSATGGGPTVSAFGVPSEQNSLILNSLAFKGSVPRDGFRLGVVSSTYDPSRGGFSGVQFALRMDQGSNTVARTLHATLDAPEFQWTSPGASRFGSKYAQQILSGTLSGPLIMDRAFYATTLQLNRRTSPLVTLGTADAASLNAVNVSPDSVARLLSAIASLGIPMRMAGMPGVSGTTEGRVALRLDYVAQPTAGPLSFTTDAYYLQAGGSWRDHGAFGGPTSTPSAGSEQTHRDYWVQATTAKYLPKSILNETSLSFNGAADRSTPYLDLPSARILLHSGLPDGRRAASTLQIGGSGSSQSEARSWSSELRSQTTWNLLGGKHSLSATVVGAVDHYAISQPLGFGTFTYSSLSDFLTSTPASFTRTLPGGMSIGRGFTGAIGIGDVFVPHPEQPTALRIQFGVRIEGDRPLVHPAYNPVVNELFGRRTDRVPTRVSVLPMVGFSRPFGGMRIPGFVAAFPRGTLSGGVRLYRGSFPTGSIDLYTRETGLPEASRQLNCIGAATPIPAWKDWVRNAKAIPSQCADDAAGSVLAQSTPPVSLFAPDYVPPRSWRPTVNVTYRLRPSLSMNLGGTYALNVNTAESHDLNFESSTRFTLASEDGRPVFVSPASIVPATGAVAWTESRRYAAFAHINESRSDLRSDTRSLSAGLTYGPIGPGSNASNFSLSYFFSEFHEQTRGFGGTTAGDPTTVAWSAGNGARHVITFSGTVRHDGWGAMSVSARAQSGNRYTPTVRGDINGDGYSNDRAFVFIRDQPSAVDSALASQMAVLLREAPADARRCLERQRGRVAERNSCVGPWSMPMLNASLSPDSYRLGLGNRGAITVYVTNLLSGLDQLVHGADGLHGWGQWATPDPSLLTVTGFEPAASRFLYTLNPLFGNATAFRNRFRSPFSVSFEFRLDLSPDRETQFIRSVMRPHPEDAGTENLTEQQIKQHLTRTAVTAFDQILRLKDSLKLRVSQVESLTALSRRVAERRDSIVSALSQYLAERKGDFKGEEVRRRWHEAAVVSYRTILNEAARARDLLASQLADPKTAELTARLLRILNTSPTALEGMLRGPLNAIP